MTAFVLDTSVAVSWYLPESASVAARIWQKQLLNEEVRLLVPGFHFLEFANVLRTYVRRGELEESLAHDLYSVHLDAPLEVIDPPRNEVLRTALEYGSTVYDATFISLARLLDVKLLTAERTTRPWVVKMGERAVVVGAG